MALILTTRPAMGGVIGAPRTMDSAGLVVLLAVLGLAPFFVDSRYWINTLTLAMIFAMWASSWDFFSGLTGRENFGHALFIGIGAYTGAFLGTMDGWPTIANLPVGVLIAVVAAALIGLAALRLTGPYFALATLTATAIAERTMIVLGPLTGGEEGVFGIPRLLGSRINLYYLTWVLFGLSLIALILLARSRLGLVLRAVHGDEATCRAAGLNTTVYKVVGLMVSGGIAGLGGVLYAHQQLYINPHAFAVILSVTVIIMAYVGGLGSIWGPAVAAIGLTILTEVLREVGEFRLFVYTGLLIVIVFFMPGGLVAPLWRRMTGGRHG